jgi:hypothetical protein
LHSHDSTGEEAGSILEKCQVQGKTFGLASKVNHDLWMNRSSAGAAV